MNYNKKINQLISRRERIISSTTLARGRFATFFFPTPFKSDLNGLEQKKKKNTHTNDDDAWANVYDKIHGRMSRDYSRENLHCNVRIFNVFITIIIIIIIHKTYTHTNTHRV